MPYQQLRTPNLNIAYTGGWCLKAVREAFGIGTKHNTALEDWNGGDKQYGDPPKGFAVPVYFSLGNEPAGHVAIHLPDGKVASSTRNGVNKPMFIHPNMADMIRIYAAANRGCTYLGWSREVNNVPVIEEQGDNDMTTMQVFDQVFITVADRFSNESEKEAYRKSAYWNDNPMDAKPYTHVQLTAPNPRMVMKMMADDWMTDNGEWPSQEVQDAYKASKYYSEFTWDAQGYAFVQQHSPHKLCGGVTDPETIEKARNFDEIGEKYY